MKLVLSDAMTIREVNRNFQKEFPYLKLEFYHCEPSTAQTSLTDDRVSVGSTLGELAGVFGPTAIEIEPHHTVTELEQKFHRKLGVFVKVYQNINGVWQRTSHSDHLGLDKQNALGRFSPKYNFNKNTLFL